MMKRISNLLLFVVAATTIGCTKSDEPVQQPATEGDVVRFAVSQPRARATFAADPAETLNLCWEVGDKIGVSATTANQLLGANYQYAVSEVRDEGHSAKLGAVSNLYQFRWTDESAHTFYGYYPFTGEMGDGVHYLTTVSLPATQPQVCANDFSHLQNWWAMKTDPCTLQGGQGTVEFDFRGVFSIVELKLKYAAATAKERAITRVQLHAQAPLAAPIANLTLSSDKEAERTEPALIVNDGVNAVDVPLTQPCLLNESQTQSIWLLVVPGTHAAGSIGIQLESADSYRLDATIAEAVTFEPNKVYRKEVTIDPTDFYYYRDPSLPAVTYFKPVTKLADVTDGEYLFCFRYTNDPATDYLIPVAPITRNPGVSDFATANVTPYLDLGILSANSHYVWSVQQGEKGHSFYGTAANGKGYYLIGCGKNQGFSIATSTTEGGYNSYIGSYTDQMILTEVEDGSGFRLQVSGVSDRAMYIYSNSGALSLRNLPLNEKNGVVVLYKKVTE